MDQQLKKEDVGKYIIALYEDTKVQCTQIQLSMLIYLCFMEYKRKRNDILVSDMGDIHQELQRDFVVLQNGRKDEFIIEKYPYIPAQSRILFARDGTEKLKAINETLEQYKGYPVEKLQQVTSRELDIICKIGDTNLVIEKVKVR